MATLLAAGSFGIDMNNADTVDHAAQATPVDASQYSWTTTSGILIHAFSFADDITFDATAPLGGSVHALQAVDSYTVGGIGGDLLAMTTAPNNEAYWRTILDAETTIFASGTADFSGAGDFVRVSAGELLTGADDLFEGAVGSGIQIFSGDSDTMDPGAVLTGGDDIINMRGDGRISGDANLVSSGTLNGGDDTIVVDGALSLTFVADAGVAGDVYRIFIQDLLTGPAMVFGGNDNITVLASEAYVISGDVFRAEAALGRTDGGADLIDASANGFQVSLVGDAAVLGQVSINEVIEVRGGNDTLIGSATVGNILSGDAGSLLSADAVFYAGADALTGGMGNDDLDGDFRHNNFGASVLIDSTYTGDDTIYGGGGNDTMDGEVGDDTLDGGMGNDDLDGGSQTAGTGDIVAFNTLNVAVSVDLMAGFAFGQGTDSLFGFESIRGSNRSDSLTGDTLDNQIEGLNGKDQIFGRGGADTLLGANGNDTLNGGGGIDQMEGGAGNDTFVVNDAGDTVVEADGNGTDLVQSSVSFNLSGLFIENLTLTGGGNSKGTGNSQANTLIGNTGNNLLNGTSGSDQMTGNAGNDAFRFRTALGASNIDTITDFSVAADTIQLHHLTFASIVGTGTLSPGQFVANASGTAQDGDDRIIYETDTGKLFYDSDGNAAGGAVQFGLLSSGLALTNADFFIIF